jgi:helicase
LYALFTDTLGEGAELLVDEQATRATIEERFEQLASCEENDVVVIVFSGHGSETHELVTYDADVADLASTCVPLDTLTEWFGRIPARRLVCILDCCFSGEMGAKVLKVDVMPRSMASADARLDQLSGEGRLIITASKAMEPAWENRRIGHGLLTYHLIEGLRGAEEVREGGKIAVYRLLEYVTRRVADGAGRLGREQNPTLRGTIDGELMWPVFTPRERYHAVIPRSAPPLVTAEILSLEPYGFPPVLLDAWSASIASLNHLQMDAINEFGVLDGKNVVVVAPTSSGKTMIGELAALKGALERKRALFLLPMRALVNDKYREFSQTYGGYGLRVIRATGEVSDDIPDLMRGRYDVCLMTYEKFTNMALANDYLLDQIGTIVVDEVQMIADQSRGTNLEFLLTLLRVRSRSGDEPQLVVLSAVVGDTSGLERWLGARLLRRDERPVPLNEGVLKSDGHFRYLDPEGEEHVEPCIEREYRKGSSQDYLIPLARRLIEDGEKFIVFRETKSETVSVARYLARELGLSPVVKAIAELPAGDPSSASASLQEALSGGVAFHNADLDREERRVVEEHFREPDGELRVIVATTTLAMGVNTPASSVIVVGLQHPGQVPYSVAEYKNIVGRAGRLGFTERGTSYLLALKPSEEFYMWQRYVTGTPEGLSSRFLVEDIDPRSLVLRVVAAAERAAGRGLDPEDVLEFLEESFGAFQQKQSYQSWSWNPTHVAEALHVLEGHELVKTAQGGGLRLTPLGRLAESGIEVETVIRLVEALNLTSATAINTATLIGASCLTVELDQLYFPFNKKSTQKEPYMWAQQLQYQRIAPSVLNAMQRSATDQHTPTVRAKKAVACLLWMTEGPLSQIEKTLIQFGGAFAAAGPICAVSSRVLDVLPVVTRIAELLHPGLDLTEQRTRLMARLEVGLPASAAELAVHLGGRITRADYLRLLRAELCTPDALEIASDEVLLEHLGRNDNKLSAVRAAVLAYRVGESERMPPHSILPSPED